MNYRDLEPGDVLMPKRPLDMVILVVATGMTRWGKRLTMLNAETGYIFTMHTHGDVVLDYTVERAK